jgi:hypothetical protein
MAIKPMFKPRLSGHIPQISTKCLTQLIFYSRPSNPFSLRCVWSNVNLFKQSSILKTTKSAQGPGTPPVKRARSRNLPQKSNAGVEQAVSLHRPRSRTDWSRVNRVGASARCNILACPGIAEGSEVSTPLAVVSTPVAPVTSTTGPAIKINLRAPFRDVAGAVMKPERRRRTGREQTSGGVIG